MCMGIRILNFRGVGRGANGSWNDWSGIAAAAILTTEGFIARNDSLYIIIGAALYLADAVAYRPARTRWAIMDCRGTSV